MGGSGRLRSVTRLLALSAAGALLLAAGPAAAESRPPGEGGAYVDDNGDPTAVAREGSDRPGRSSRSGASDCEWRLITADDTKFAIYDEGGNRLHSDTGRWFERWCDGRQVMADDPIAGGFAVPERVPRVDPAQLAQEARQSVSVPSPAMLTSPRSDRGLYTRVRTWLWLDGSWWRGYTATAEAGGVSTTVSATPVRATWRMGDGGQTVCDGPGVEWRAGMADDATYCSYVYEDSSVAEREGVFTMTVTVEFEVTWTSNVGAGGVLPRISRSASQSVRVGEIQAVETS